MSNSLKMTLLSLAALARDISNTKNQAVKKIPIAVRIVARIDTNCINLFRLPKRIMESLESDSLSVENQNEKCLAEDVTQNIKNAAKQRLKAIKLINEISSSPVNLKSDGGISHSLYSDEELEPSEIIRMDDNEEEKNSVNKADDNDEMNCSVKRLYRTERTKSTDSDLSEGEIVDDDDDEEVPVKLQPDEKKTEKEDENKAKNVLESFGNFNQQEQFQRMQSNFHNNRPVFDLRQRIQTQRGRFRGNFRGRGFGNRGRGSMNNRFQRRRSRSQSPYKRSRSPRSPRDRKSRSKSSEIKSTNSLLTEIASSLKSESSSGKTLKEKLKLGLSKDRDKKHEKRKSHKHGKKKDKKSEKKIKPYLIEQAKELTTSDIDDCPDIIDLKRQIIDLQAELANPLIHEKPTEKLDKILPKLEDSEPKTPPTPPLPEMLCKDKEIQPENKITCDAKIQLEKKLSEEKTPIKQKDEKPKAESGEKKSENTSSSEKHKNEKSSDKKDHKSHRSRSRTPNKLKEKKSSPDRKKDQKSTKINECSSKIDRDQKHDK
uniref:CSON014176 protein n=1 Tax=Culicoides sonorensis TaxID=179676 RepID=A0A336MFI6_CULSO